MAEGKENSFILNQILTHSKLSSLSPLTIELIDLATREDTSAKDLVQIIEKDPALTTRILKLANSAFFGLRQPVSTISRAVVLLGFNRVRLMALTLSLRDTFPVGKVWQMDFEKFWRTSLYRASLASKLAEQVGEDAEEAFITGLILEVGLLLLFEILPEEIKKEFPGNKLPLKELLAWEQEHFGIDHRQIGKEVLTHWKFPPEMVACQCYPLPEDASLLCQIVYLAGWAAEMFWGEGCFSYTWYEQAEKKLGLSSSELNKVVCEIFEEVDVLAQELKLNMNKKRDILAIMEKANQAIFKINLQLEQRLQKVVAQVNQMEVEEEGFCERLLDAVAHEIRNPLVALGGFARRLKEVERYDPKIKSYAQVIVNEASRLERVLKDITQYVQPYEPKQVLVELKAFLNEIIVHWKERATQQGIEIKETFPPEEITLKLDKEAIKQVLNKLIENAFCSILPQKGKIVLILEVEAETVRICVLDNGQGYEERVLRLLTQRPFTDKTFDPGLGAPWIKKIIKAHKGHLQIESKKGEGTKVCIILPHSA